MNSIKCPAKNSNCLAKPKKVFAYTECLIFFSSPERKLLHAVRDEEFQKGIHELHETQTLAEEVCRYDLDYLDVTWLESLNDQRDLMGMLSP